MLLGKVVKDYEIKVNIILMNIKLYKVDCASSLCNTSLALQFNQKFEIKYIKER